jgi:hypothetical protein
MEEEDGASHVFERKEDPLYMQKRKKPTGISTQTAEVHVEDRLLEIVRGLIGSALPEMRGCDLN